MHAGEQWFITNLPRHADLHGRSDKVHPDNLFSKIVPNFTESLWQNSFKAREDILAKLPSEAWEQLAKKALPYVVKRDPRRGWYQLVNHLDEARGWVLLKDRGYADIRFLGTQNEKTPDLLATKDGFTAVLEVKSVNESDQDINSRAGPPRVFDVRYGLSEKFKHRLFRSIREACEQLEAYPDKTDTRIALLVVRLETDGLFVPQNYTELEQLISSQTIPGIEVVHQNTL